MMLVDFKNLDSLTHTEDERYDNVNRGHTCETRRQGSLIEYTYGLTEKVDVEDYACPVN